MAARFFNSDEPKLEVQGGLLALHSPYNRDFVYSLKNDVPYAGRKWDNVQRVWLIDPQYGRQVRDLVQTHYGININVPSIKANTEPVTRLLEVRYIGSAKEREDGTKSAFGWVDGQWAVLFPESVLKNWFGLNDEPDAPTTANTLYSVLGVKRNVSGSGLKRAYRRAARAWHPDVCSETDAKEQFIRIQSAWESLSNPAKRARYDAGLRLQNSVSTAQLPFNPLAVWKPPVRCGWILTEGLDKVGRFNVSRILQWEDIINEWGEALVTSWIFGNDEPQERWV